MRGIVWAFKTSKPLLKEFFPLTIMVALQSLLALAVVFADNLMLGIYSEQSMAAASIVYQIQFLLQQFVFAAGLGIIILGSEFWNEKNPNTFKKITVIGLVFSIAAGIFVCLICVLFPQWTMSLFTNDVAIIEEGVRYLRIMCWTFIIFSISMVLLYTLHSMEAKWIGIATSALALCINAVLNYALIFGNFGAPELGIQGAGYATLASRGIELVIVLIYVLAIDKKLRFNIRELFYFDRFYVRDYFKVAFPALLSGTLWGLAMAAQVSLLGHVSSEALAANGVAFILFQMFVAFGMAQGYAASATVDKAVNTGKLFMVKNYTKVLQLVFIGVGIVTGVLIFTTKGLLVSLYSLSPATHTLALKFMTVLAVISVFSIYSFPVESGIIATSDNIKWRAWFSNVFAWILTLLAVIIAFGLRLSPVLIFSVMRADQVLKCIPNVTRCNRYRWAKDLRD